MRPAAVRVPSSTSNLGPGFDALGLALSPSLVARYEPGPGTLEIEWRGTLAGLAATPDQDLAAGAFTRALPADYRPSGHLTLDSEIPVGRGLGSSAAARVAGAYLAAAVMGESPDPSAIVGRVATEEGHPDNAVPAVFGGFRVATYDHDRLVSTALPLSPEVGMVFVDPGIEMRTEDARRVLPAEVPLAHATRTAARVAMLVQGLAGADGDLIALGLADVLHVPFRLPLLPGGAEAVAAGREAGAWGVTLSGSGSGLIAFTPLVRRDAVCAALVEAFRRAGRGGAHAYSVQPDLEGARLLTDRDDADAGEDPDLSAERRPS